MNRSGTKIWTRGRRRNQRSEGSSSTGFVLATDPDILAQRVVDTSRFPAPDMYEEVRARELAETIEVDVDIDWFKEYDRIAPLLDRIPKVEADTFELYFFLRKRQKDIATVMGCTQAAISYRLQASRRRLKFLMSWPGLDLTEDDVEACLKPHTIEFGQGRGYKNGKLTVKVMMSMLTTTCQSASAKVIGLNQSAVRSRFLGGVRTLDYIRVDHPELEIYFHTFKMVRDHPNALHDIEGMSHRARIVEENQILGSHAKTEITNINALAELESLFK